MPRQPQDAERRYGQHDDQDSRQALGGRAAGEHRRGLVRAEDETAGEAVQRLVGPVGVGREQRAKPVDSLRCTGGQDRRQEQRAAEREGQRGGHDEPAPEHERKRDSDRVQLDDAGNPERQAGGHLGQPRGDRGRALAGPDGIRHKRGEPDRDQHADHEVYLADEDGTEHRRVDTTPDGGKPTP